MREGMLIADRYEVTAAIGPGGMGEVWEGYDRRLDRRVAVKFIRRTGLLGEVDYEQAVRRFAREARVTAKLEHPGVPTVFDLGSHDGETYLAMQLVIGRTLKDVIAEQGPLPGAWAAAIGAQVCSVLATAHAGSMIHRDLKPSNLMLCPDGSVKVLDFGIAALLDAVDLTRLTTTGQLLGTPAYMAPEQFTGEELGPATDLYALGCVLYELLAGQPPFGADHPFQLMRRHQQQAPPALAPVRPDLPAALAELVGQLLAKSAPERPAHAGEVYLRLLPHVAEGAERTGGSAVAQGPTRPYHYPLGPLPVLRAAPKPPSGPSPAPQPVPAGGGAAAQALQRQQQDVVELVGEGRVTEAGEVLAEAVRAAAASLGPSAAEVVDARLALARVYLLAGDHRRALAVQQELLPDLARHYGEEHSLVWGTRRSIAECQSAIGDHARARAELRELVAARVQQVGPADSQVRELRAELARLEGTGR
ncbi:protein kinase [Natronosporangium hydrolyticum]|uniref:non-specific serine/threonine protein kinase n=1 Tax=Natronosporangium hydrolyticum TaxID=2811111 RepID=A0A895YHQ1_9ACTN|nr:serine/threonine-protein kinase [Natronosporangium hydrolyticum]QSB13258.1 protein kinase [Natronosporangium hydrolyticum]